MFPRLLASNYLEPSADRRADIVAQLVVYEVDLESGAACVLEIFETDSVGRAVGLFFSIFGNEDPVYAQCPSDTPGAVAVGNHFGLPVTRRNATKTLRKISA